MITYHTITKYKIKQRSIRHIVLNNMYIIYLEYNAHYILYMIYTHVYIYEHVYV